MARLRRSLMTILALAFLGYAAICVLLFVSQDSMVFFPSTAPREELEESARGLGFTPWKNSAGEVIGWQSLAGDPTSVLLVCHGNGGYALHGSIFAEANRRMGDSGWKTFLLEYPGYGSRPGSPSESTLTSAAIDAVDALATDPDRRIYLLGQSLGSGVASATAAARPDHIAGVILITPFDSLPSAARGHYPWLPVGLLLRHRFDSVRHLECFHGRVAFILAANDTTVPAALGRRLYAARTGPKRMWVAPGAGHNDTDLLLEEWPAIVRWLIDGE